MSTIAVKALTKFFVAKHTVTQSLSHSVAKVRESVDLAVREAKLTAEIEMASEAKTSLKQRVEAARNTVADLIRA